MTRADLIALMLANWTGDASAGLSSPLSTAQTDMISAQLGAVADGILAAMAGGVPGSTPQWVEEELGSGAAGSSFALTHAPTDLEGVFIFWRGQLLEGCTFSGVGLKTVALPISKTTTDTITAKYQALVPT